MRGSHPVIYSRKDCLLLLWGWAGYFVAHYLTETQIPPERCTPVSLGLDSRIPFCEWFLIPYVFWYFLIAFSLGHFFRKSADSFVRLQSFFILAQIFATAIYVLFPSRQELRPEFFPRDNLLSRGVALIYRIDTNTGVCPSLHVALSLGIASVWLKAPEAGAPAKSLIGISVVLICLSTLFIKQHSALDLLAALPLGLAAELIVYRDRYFPSPRGP